MMHKNRRWGVVAVEGEDRADKLAALLTDHSWCSCNGWRVDGEWGHYLFLNDQTSANGAFEVGVIRCDTWRQVESITFSWCDRARAEELIAAVLAGSYDDQSWPSGVSPDQVQPSALHGLCGHCR